MGGLGSSATTGPDQGQRPRAEARDRRGSQGQRAEARRQRAGAARALAGRPVPTEGEPHRQTAAPPGQSLSRTDRAGWGEQGKGEDRGRGERGGGTAAPPPERDGYQRRWRRRPSRSILRAARSSSRLGVNRPRLICSATRAAWAAVMKTVARPTPRSDWGCG